MFFSSTSTLVLGLLTLPLVVGCSGRGISFNGPTTTIPQPATDPFLPVTTGGAAPAVTNALYVIQPPSASLQSPSYVLEYAKDATGNAEPISQITGPSGVLFDQIAVDAAGNLFVQGFRNVNSEFDIYIYPAGATGTATPSAIIPHTNANALWVDAAGKLYTVGSNVTDAIRVYDSTTPGAAPLRTITPTPAIISAQAITTDSSAGIYVLNLGMGQTGAIFVFSSSAIGATSPLATISGPATGLLAPQGLAVDSAGNIYVGSFDSTKLAGSILVFAPGSTGNVTPVRIISGPNTLLGPIEDLRLDQAGTLYVNSARPGRVSFGAHILTFASGASGDVAPVSDLAAETSSVNHVTETFSKLAVF